MLLLKILKWGDKRNALYFLSLVSIFSRSIRYNWKPTTQTNVLSQIISAEHVYPPWSRTSAKTQVITAILQVAIKPYCSTVSLNMNAAYGQKHPLIQLTLNRLQMLEELCICKYRAIMLESSKETEVPDWATVKTPYVAAKVTQLKAL